MLGIVRSVITAARLYLMRRRQFDNIKLRRYFANFEIEVGLYSYGCFDRWRMPGPLRIGRYCSFASTVIRVPANHPMDALTTHPVLYENGFGVVDNDLSQTQGLEIEDDVWIGHYAIILPKCKYIGRGAIIGAGSVVTDDVERYTIVAGNPARKIRDRFTPELAAEIERSRWWELDLIGFRRLVKSQPDLAFRPTADALRRWFVENKPATSSGHSTEILSRTTSGQNDDSSATT